MTVDVKLLAVLALPLVYVFAVLQAVLWLLHREQRIYLFWAVANLVAALGATLFVSRELLPLWVGTSLANTVLVAGSFVIWGSMCRFNGRQIPWGGFITATVLFFIAFQGLWMVTDDLGMRVLLASLASGLLNAGIAFELLRAQRDRLLRWRAVLSAVFALHALFFLFRAATAVTLDSSMDFLQANGIQNVTVTLAAIKVVLWNSAAVMMEREQRQPAQAVGAIA